MWSKDVNKLPGLTYPHLYTFLVMRKCFYTNEELMAHKGLQAYNQFVNGWVQEVVHFQPEDSVNIVVKAK
ncbi:hypothetical protein PoB_001318100, partial [Plakobranchus ocellatus]